MRFSRLKNKLSWPFHTLKYKSLSGIKSRKEFYKVIEHERERANRNNHQVSLVVFNLESFPNDGKERKQLINNIIQEKREIDEIGWYKKHSVGVILPYTSSLGARKFSVRLSQTLNFIMPDSFCHLFSYPLQNASHDDTKIKDYRDARSTAAGVENTFDDFESTDDDVIKNTEDYIHNTSARSIS